MFATRVLNWAGAPLVAAGLATLSMGAMAHGEHDAAATTAPAAANQVVVKDAETGQLRAATPAEANALMSARSATGVRKAPDQPLLKTHTSGARGARLTEEYQSFSVAVRQPDGRVAMQCFSSREEADAAIKASALTASKPAQLPTE